MTLYRRRGIWWTRFQLNGQDYRRSTGEKTRRNAAEFENRLRTELYDLATLGHLREMRFGELLNRYAEMVVLTKSRRPDGGLRRSSLNDLGRLRKLEGYFGRDARLPHLMKPGIAAEFNRSMIRTMKPSSANKYLTMFKAVLYKAYEWGATTQQPRIKLNREAAWRNCYLTETEEKRLVRACPSDLQDFVCFILDTGARKDEAITLAWNQVTLGRRPRPVVTFVDTKNGEARTVPLPKRSATILRRLKRQQRGRGRLIFAFPASRNIARKRPATGFFARKGQLIPISNLQHRWDQARARVDLDHCRLHDLRHTYASKLIRRGVPLFYAARLLGHRTIKMTMRYSHLSPIDLDNAVAVLDR